MNLFTKHIALLLFIFSNFLSTLHADTDFSSGVTLRYFQLTSATDSNSMIGVGYSIKWGDVDYAIELGAPQSDRVFDGVIADVSEVNFYTANSVGWQKSIASKFALRTDLALANYFVSKTNRAGNFITVETEIIYSLEPKLSLLFKVSEDVDISFYGGYMLGTDSLSEPTAGVYLRMLLL